jgi:phosphoribosylanthranilate isomerase
MKLKVCGMKYPKNILDVAALLPDYMGFIFYPKSARFVEWENMIDILPSIHKSIKKVGVFVNHPLEDVIEIVDNLDLNYVQLHADESPEYVYKLKQADIKVFKVFPVGKRIDWDRMNDYKSLVDYYLFDTKTTLYGGSGKHFDWSLLQNYMYDIPFFLSGGIQHKDIAAIKQLQLLQLHGLDVNSRLESDIAFKDVNRIAQLKIELEND